MLRNLIAAFILLSAGISLTAPPPVWAADAPAAKKEKKKSRTQKKKESAKAKREAAKAKKAEAKAKKEAAKKAAAAQAAFEETEATSAVGKALKNMQFIGASRPVLTADYYVVVRSSSTCPHCVKLLPDVLAAYTEMQATGKVELIYESFDTTPEKAEEHLRKQGATFPAAMRAQMCNLPGAAPLLVPPPAAYIVDAEGNRLASGPLAPVLANWRKHTIEQ